MRVSKRLIFPLVFLCGLLCAWVIYKPLSAPPKLTCGTHGYFPLYDTNCIARVKISQYPYRLCFVVLIAAGADAPIRLDGAKISLEGFNAEGVKVYKEDRDWRDFNVVCPHPAEKEPLWQVTVFVGTAFSGEKHAAVGKGHVPFKKGEKCYFVLRVVAPCDQYECASTMLDSYMCN